MAEWDLRSYIVVQEIVLGDKLRSSSDSNSRYVESLFLNEEVILVTKNFIILEESIELIAQYLFHPTMRRHN